MMMRNLRSKYDGMGFVEALIAIMVVGASSIVLMQIATSTLQNMIQNETIDTMTQYAVEGATMVQNVAMQEKYTGEDVFPSPIDNTNNCYVIDKDSENQYFFRPGEQGLKTYRLDERSTYKNEALVTENEDHLFFRIYCIENYVETDRYVIVKIVVGQSNTEDSGDGSVTKGNNVKDYTYLTVVNL